MYHVYSHAYTVDETYSEIMYMHCSITATLYLCVIYVFHKKMSANCIILSLMIIGVWLIPQCAFGQIPTACADDESLENL